MAKLERTDKPVSVLLEELRKGELGLPEIQRGYVWNGPQARDLVDSLYREYPSGLILLWKSEGLPLVLRPPEIQKPTGRRSKKRRDGKLPLVLRPPEIERNTNEKVPSYLILDGQQRLTSLAKIIDPYNKDINVYFNVEREEFQLYSSKIKSDPLWVSVKEVLNKGSVKVWKELKSKNDLNVNNDKMDEYLERLSRLEKIKDYRYPVMIIHTDDYEEITEAFIRVNFKGTRLKEAEMAMARLAFRWPRVLVEHFETALKDYENKGFVFEPRFLIRCFVAVGTGQSRFKHINNLWAKNRDELEEIWRQTKRGVDYTINFLKNNAGIESTEWIPSLNALIPLVVYLSDSKVLSKQDERRLLFWYFCATIHGRFTGSPESKLDQDLKAIKESTAALIDNLKREIPDYKITSRMITGKYQTNPSLPLLFSIFRQNKAEDWFTGTILSSTNFGPSHQLEFHHIFPKALLNSSSNKYTSEEIDDIGNIAFLSQKANRSITDSKPKDYLKDIDKEKLKAQLIPIDETLWELENFKKFLDTRREMLTNAINTYLSSLASTTQN
ncbi:MAG: hypothetical protein Metus_0765 [Candidatus Methanosuratincola subterraneus]|uniref:GmrSD restriction endonucleases N-terminal domain-containing protein n=1 Tax=Methanosuratincola subterraneus TaxID=2593994 RepID=A0A444L536_METS7|nr:MAG: hypothetical protein Metus_0765 [Candidatus Methanosuratincola subterraneus]